MEKETQKKLTKRLLKQYDDPSYFEKKQKIIEEIMDYRNNPFYNLISMEKAKEKVKEIIEKESENETIEDYFNKQKNQIILNYYYSIIIDYDKKTIEYISSTNNTNIIWYFNKNDELINVDIFCNSITRLEKNIQDGFKYIFFDFSSQEEPGMYKIIGLFDEEVSVNDFFYECKEKDKNVRIYHMNDKIDEIVDSIEIVESRNGNPVLLYYNGKKWNNGEEYGIISILCELSYHPEIEKKLIFLIKNSYKEEYKEKALKEIKEWRDDFFYYLAY